MFSRPVKCSSCGRELIDYYDEFNALVDETGKKQVVYMKKHNLKDCCRRYLIADPSFDYKVSAIIDYTDMKALAENISITDIKEREEANVSMTILEERTKKKKPTAKK